MIIKPKVEADKAIVPVPLPVDVKEMLELLAEYSGESRGQLAAEAVTEMVEEQLRKNTAFVKTCEKRSPVPVMVKRLMEEKLKVMEERHRKVAKA